MSRTKASVEADPPTSVACTIVAWVTPAEPIAVIVSAVPPSGSGSLGGGRGRLSVGDGDGALLEASGSVAVSSPPSSSLQAASAEAEGDGECDEEARGGCSGCGAPERRGE